jgi:hypothetical protein
MFFFIVKQRYVIGTAKVLIRTQLFGLPEKDYFATDTCSTKRKQRGTLTVPHEMAYFCIQFVPQGGV